jgi:hypothetical protein
MHRTRVSNATVCLLVILGIWLAAAPATAQVIPPKVHAVAMRNDGHLRVTTLTVGGSWSAFQDIPGQPGLFTSTNAHSAAISGNSTLNVVVVGFGHIYHSSRANDTAAWQPFSDLTVVIGNQPSGPTELSIAGAPDGTVHVCAIGGIKSHVWHTMRPLNQSWTPWVDVTAATGTKWFFHAACSVTTTTPYQVHMTAVADQGGTATRTFHAVRTPSGTWTGLGDLTSAAGGSTSYPTTDCSAIGQELHVLLNASPALQHAKRFGDGSWTGFGNVLAQTGAVPGGGPWDASSARVGGDLYVAASGGAVADDDLFYTIRFANGSWANPWRSIKAATGSTDMFAKVSLAAQQQLFIVP